MEQFQTKIERLNFFKEIPLKMNRTKITSSPKNLTHLQFKKEIPLNIIRNKKKSTMKLGLKNTL